MGSLPTRFLVDFKQEEELLKKLNWTGGSTPEEVNSFNDSFSEIQG